MKTQLIFECCKCGQCCHGYGGTYVTPADIEHIARYLGEAVEGFQERYCRLSGGKPLLTQNAAGYCIFWDTVCTIHPVKPRMCKAWPYLESICIDVGNWHAMASACPGMRTDVPYEMILTQVRKELNRKNRTRG